MNLLISVLFSYILGSIPTGYIFGKLIKGIDIREHGSGNVGATNALRVLGTKIGIITLILDVLKGYFAMFIASRIITDPTNLHLIIIGFAVIIGHIFTIFLKFKGGKGVATSAGVFIFLTPIPVIFALIVFILTVSLSRFISLGSILASLTLFVTELIMNFRNQFSDKEKLILVAIVMSFIIIRHISNIKRIFAGNENKLTFGKK
ncbi:MAG: glycerol-3-phosphate 1-O-acyltransferase PlsY [Candidatus Cloacimonetes bacterium]|nr:glycerol-3-phosphate 1-O-acyltransferase PlsY [Candidatus Cloacimonadota bacterium]